MAEFLDGNQDPQLDDGEEYQSLTETIEADSAPVNKLTMMIYLISTKGSLLPS